MDVILGNLERHCDGVFSGIFRSLTARAQLELRPTGVGSGEQR